jgi:hypothetical protein
VVELFEDEADVPRRLRFAHGQPMRK